MVVAAGFQVGFRSSAMPHFGHVPGSALSTPAHIGQKYFFAGLSFAVPLAVSAGECV
jgi:hypothetical protein